MFRKIFLAVCCFTPVVIMGQGTFKITSGTTLKINGGAVITLDNMHLENDGDLSLAAGDGTFGFTGNLNTNISGTSMPLFDVMEIAKVGAELLRLYDAKGSLVLVKRTVLLPGSNQFPVPLKMLAQGMYELKVEYGTGKIKTFKLVMR